VLCLGFAVVRVRALVQFAALVLSNRDHGALGAQVHAEFSVTNSLGSRLVSETLPVKAAQISTVFNSEGLVLVSLRELEMLE
jgi:hypothetical protein